MTKRKRGRPADPTTRRERVLVRGYPHEKAAWVRAAADHGHDLSSWMRWVCNRAAGVE